MGVVPFSKMNGAELTEVIKNLSSFSNEQQRVLLELIAVKRTIAEGSYASIAKPSRGRHKIMRCSIAMRTCQGW